MYKKQITYWVKSRQENLFSYPFPCLNFYYTLKELIVLNGLQPPWRKTPHAFFSVVHLVRISISLNYRTIWLIGTKTTSCPLESKLKKSNFPLSEKDNSSDFAVSVTIVHSLTQSWKPEIIFLLSPPFITHPELPGYNDFPLIMFLISNVIKCLIGTCPGTMQVQVSIISQIWMTVIFFLFVNDLYRVSFTIKLQIM
jgi:hypothetical protein